MTKLVRRGILRNARFAVAVLLYGRKNGRPLLVRWDAKFPSLLDLQRRKVFCSPIAWGTAHLTAIFVKHMPLQLAGVYVPEALPVATRRKILRTVRSSGIRLTKKVTCLKAMGSDE
jgi:hypothetical protein